MLICYVFLVSVFCTQKLPTESISSAKRKYLKYDELKRIVIYLCILCLRSAWLEKILRTLICLHVICPEINVCGFLRKNILGLGFRYGKSCAVKRTTASSSNKRFESCDSALRAHYALQYLQHSSVERWIYVVSCAISCNVQYLLFAPRGTVLCVRTSTSGN